MKKLTVLAIAFLLGFPFLSKSQDLTLDKILQKHFEVMNTEKLAELNSISFAGKASMQGMEMPYSQIIKRPGKMKLVVEIQGNKMIQAFNGEVGWMIAPWVSPDPQDMGESETAMLKEQADIEGELWNWKEKVDTLELLGKEDMEGTEVYNIKVTKTPELKEGETEEDVKPNIRNYYIDAENFVILKVHVKTMMQGAEIELDTYSSDYKEVGGFLISHSMEVKMSGQTIRNVTVETVEYNKEYEDAIFDRPVKK